MDKHTIDFDEIQKAMEDTGRDAFDYFLDTSTGDVVILSEDIISRARELLSHHLDDDTDNYEEVEFDEETDLPEWMEDEIDLALDIFLYEKDRYARIPERDPRDCYTAMTEFSAQVANPSLRSRLLSVLDGQGAFRKFKDALAPFPSERKQWYSFNAKSMRNEIAGWLSGVLKTEGGS